MILRKIFGALALAVVLFASCSDGSDGSDNKGGSSATPTPNDGACPTFSPIGGFYREPQAVTISCEEAATIYYTVLKPTRDSSGNWDETAWQEAVRSSKPSEESTKYSEPFEIKEQCIVRAVAVKADGTKNYAMTAFDFDLDHSTDFSGPWSPINPKSDDWQDQTIYFILTDRFFNGDKTNDKIAGLKDQNGNAYDESKVLQGQPASGYNGGDIEGVRQKLTYIKDLGFTAIWMTPPVKCQVAESNYHGYHGYWASDFTEVDSHMGTLKQYQQFVKEAHEMGLYVIQDIVVNHTGDYQKITSDITDVYIKENEGKVTENIFRLEGMSVPFNHPEQLPWALNNVNDLTYDEFKNNAFYHYSTPISDYTISDLNYIYTHQSSDLDDMATDNEVVRNLLRGYFRYWIDKTGIDGYRIDTALYVEPEFFEGFINDTTSDNMGVRVYGKSKEKTDFINFGEAFTSSEPIVGSYTKSKDGKERMDSMIYFPLRNAIANTISSGGKTKEIADVLSNRYTKNYYANPNRLVTFIDNHDIDRWGQTMKGNEELMKAAYAIIYTIPGIPQVYYGSEQGFDGECREGMFQGSYKSPGTTQSADRFDTANEWYKYFQNLNKMRAENDVFRYNTLYTLQSTSDGAGIFSYIVRQTNKETGKPLESFEKGQKAIFVMNTASTDKILDASYAGLFEGDKFKIIDYEGICAKPLGGTEFTEEFTAVKKDSKINIQFIVPAHSCAIYLLEEVGVPTEESNVDLSVDEVPTGKVTQNSITIKGTTSVSGDVKIVLNGDYTLAESVNATANEPFEKSIDIGAYSNGKITVQLVQTVDNKNCFSDIKTFTIERPFVLIQTTKDTIDDDNGVGSAKGMLQRPTDAQFDGSLDIHGVDVYKSGNDILLGVKMGGISNAWNPTTSLFDHVVFYIFISDGKDDEGCEYHPKSNYKLPVSFGKWDYMYQCNGWGNSFYKAMNASSSNLGTATTPCPTNEPGVDWKNVKLDDTIPSYAKLDWSAYKPKIGDEFTEKPGMIYFKISAAAMGYPKDITGYKFYVNTWDFDMGSPRGVKEGDASQYKFGSGNLNPNDIPLVCDELDEPIVIK